MSGYLFNRNSIDKDEKGNAVIILSASLTFREANFPRPLSRIELYTPGKQKQKKKTFMMRVTVNLLLVCA